ncbi:MAG: ATP-grasp domain-containing protein, partial [Myxococcota bacterium]
MNIHEHQGKEILREYGVAVPEGRAAFTVDEAVAAAEELGGDVFAVKAQIHAGGRGKGGGVKIAKGVAQVRTLADQILGMQLVTHQTGPEGQKVRRVYIEQGMNLDGARELYLGMVVDRATRCVVVMASTEGGVDIEEVAAQTPEKIHKIAVDPMIGFADYQGRELAFKLGLEGKAVFRAVKLFKGLYRAFVEKDCSLAEINPLVATADGNIIALDAKMNFDDNALFRHKDIAELR